MLVPKRVEDVKLDYSNGILIINGEKIKEPVKVTVKEMDGWDISKLFNCEKCKQVDIPPELIIDTRKFVNELEKQEMKEIIRGVMKEDISPTEKNSAGENELSNNTTLDT